MTIRSETDVVLEHALASEDNLAIALTIGAAYQELCGRVIAAFLASVEERLAPQLAAHWQVAACRDHARIAERWTPMLTARFLPHPAGLQIVLGAGQQGYPKSPYFAVTCQGVGGRPLPPDVVASIKQAIDSGYAPGKASDASIWYRDLDRAYSGWGSGDVLLRFYQRKEALDYFVGHLERLARVLENAWDDGAFGNTPRG